MCGVSCVNKLRAQVSTLEGVKSCDISFEKGGVASPKRFNRVLKLAKGTPHAEMINVMVLRSQAQADPRSSDRRGPSQRRERVP